MSLNELSMLSIIKKQYLFKIKSYTGALSALLTAQLIALLFSFNGSGSSSSGSSNISFSIQYYSANIVIMFTMIWAFIMAVLITTKAYRNDDFVFITNRFSSHVANYLYLITLSIIGGVTAMLSGFLLKVMMYYFFGTDYLFLSSPHLAAFDYIQGVIGTIFYLVLLCSLGYLVGTLVQWQRIFILILPAFFVGSLLFGARIPGQIELITSVFQFFIFESSFILFLLKVVLTVGLLQAATLALSNRLEVR